ncbi:MAG: glycosyltransferase family 2 protein [Burkholderiales bacterium]|nr:glycosyltransferase family 2 protein [Burkholderiales bacterium]
MGLLLKKANDNFIQGNYKVALDKYIELKQSKYLANVFFDIIQFNITYSEQKLYEIVDVNNIPLKNVIRYVDRYASNFSCTLEKYPLVSVIVTTYNDVDNLIKSISNLLEQTYPNIEIIVVDDNSTDDTSSKISGLLNDFDKIKYIRLSENLGTYFAKNVAIKASSGEYLFFQDSDDFSHNDRILLCVDHIMQNNAKIINCEYSRYINEKIVRVNGIISRLGRITLGFHRSIIGEIGYFNCTTKASDDELYQRIICYYGNDSVFNLCLPLYYAAIRNESLSSDMGSQANNMVQILSEDRANYVRHFKDVHSELPKKSFKSFFHFPRVKDAIPVDDGMSSLANPSIKVIIGVFLDRNLDNNEIICDYLNQCDHLVIFAMVKQEIDSNYDNKLQMFYNRDYNKLKVLASEMIVKFKELYGEFIWVPINIECFKQFEYVNKVLKRNVSHLSKFTNINHVIDQYAIVVN